MSRWKWATTSTRNTFRYKHMVDYFKRYEFGSFQTYQDREGLTDKEMEDLIREFESQYPNDNRRLS